MILLGEFFEGFLVVRFHKMTDSFIKHCCIQDQKRFFAFLLIFHQPIIQMTFPHIDRLQEKKKR